MPKANRTNIYKEIIFFEIYYLPLCRILYGVVCMPRNIIKVSINYIILESYASKIKTSKTRT